MKDLSHLNVRGAEIGVLTAVALLHLALGIAFVQATPVLEAPDEARHFGFILDWARTGTLPTMEDGNHGFAAHEAFQPPLYYALGLILTADIALDDADTHYRWRPGAPIGRADLPGPRNMLEPTPPRKSPPGVGVAALRVRWLSLCLSLTTVLLVWACARAAGAAPGSRLFATCLVAFNPMFLFIGTSVNNDVLVTTLSTAGLLSCLVALDRPMTFGRGLGLGGLAGLCAIAKLSGMVLVPVIAALVVVRRWRGDGAVSPAIGAVLGFVGTAGWWFWWQYAQYGTAVPSSRQAAIVGNSRASVEPLALLWEWEGFFKSFWGVFGAFNIIYPEWMYRLLLAVTLTLTASVLWSIFRSRCSPRHLLPLTMVLANLLAVGWWTSMLMGSQGRLMFPSIAGIAVLSGMSLSEWPSRAAAAFGAAVLVGLLIASVYSSVVLIPRSYLWG